MNIIWIAKIMSPNNNPFLPDCINFLKLTFRPIATMAIVRIPLPKYSDPSITDLGMGKIEPTRVMAMKAIKYHGSLK